jgi:hypothetical protein
MADTNHKRRHRKVSREPLSLFPETLRFCPRCSHNLPPTAFNRDGKNRDGLSSVCRKCHGAAKKLAYPAVAAVHALRHLKRTYALEPAAFAAMVEAQGNRCAICDKDMGLGKARHVDHCHVTGRVRALLCHHCNCALGHADDSSERLRAMADYLERHAVE